MNARAMIDGEAVAAGRFARDGVSALAFDDERSRMEAPEETPSYLRAQGAVHLTCDARRGRTRLANLRQEGALNARFPRREDDALEVVLINIAGGVAAGDRHLVEASVKTGARALLTSAAAEKVYRSPAAASVIDVRLTIDGSLEWLPQETILFNEARLTRRMSVDMAADASLLMAETVVLGRAAMGEEFRRGALRDQWRLRRAGELIYADGVRLDGDVANILARSATASGARSFATLLYVAPDAEARLDEARALVEDLRSPMCDAGVSAWDGVLAARWLGREARALRQALAAFLTAFRAKPLPRVWAI